MISHFLTMISTIVLLIVINKKNPTCSLTGIDLIHTNHIIIIIMVMICISEALVISDCLTCTFRASCCSARLSRTQILSFACSSVRDKTKSEALYYRAVLCALLAKMQTIQPLHHQSQVYVRFKCVTFFSLRMSF